MCVRRCASKNENDSGIKDIMHNLMEDLLVLYNLPEWPAAEVALNVIAALSVSAKVLLSQMR